MQNSIPARPSILNSGAAPKLPFHGCRWRQSDCLGVSLLRKAVSADGGRTQLHGFKVSAFFGGSKNSDIKDAGKGCFRCLGKGAVDCSGCKGTGRNKKNGNMFERWKCYDCQGFGLVGCPKCGKGGLTPEQRGER